MIQPNSAPQPDGPFQPGSSLIPLQSDINAEYHLKLGKSLYQSFLVRSSVKDLEAAVHHFQKAVEIQPDLAEAYVQLASALWDQGAINLELAQFYCETALKLDPSQANANLYLGYFLQRAGFIHEAVQQYQQAIRKSFLHSARARIALGHALLKQSSQSKGNIEQIRLATQGLLQFGMGCGLLPMDKQACMVLREAVMTDAQFYSINYLAKGFKKLRMHGVARNLYKLGTRLMPQEATFYHLLGDDYLFDANNAEAAIEYYKKAQALDPKEMNLLKKLGKAYSSTNDNANAVAALDAVVEQDRQDFDSLFQLAQLHMEERAYFKALYHFKEAEKLQPHHPYLHSNMAYVLFKMDDVDGAFEEYKLALEYGTDPVWLSTVAQTLGTIAYQVHDDLQEALDFLQQSLHYNPDNQETLGMLADLYFDTGHMEMALAAYKSLLQIQPDNANCYSNIGYILWQMDKNEPAIDAYLSAIHYDPDNYIALNNLGVIYLDDQGLPEKALPLFEKALALKPTYTLACFNIGRATQLLGRTMEAAEAYSKALELNQLTPELEDAEIQYHLDSLFS